MKPNHSNGFGVASLVLGILSIILFWVPFLNIVLGILGIVFSIKQKRISSNGLATAGLVTSIIGLVFSTLVFIIWLLAYFGVFS
jgi:hypothetical protein